MKFLHISDLHIGKKVNGFSMLEDQEYILDLILKIADSENVNGILIAGDVYDKSIPSAESVRLFDRFLTSISSRNISAFIISGNHDSAERISFGSKLMEKSGIYLSPVFNGNIDPIILNDEYGEVAVYMLPFIKPAHINHIAEQEKNSYTASSYDEAVNYAVKNYINIDSKRRNIIIAHQFVTGAKTCESEEMSVGGTENISADNFKDFDYAALGHIHSPQHISKEIYRYCGTPLKYSLSEVNDQKSVTIVELKEKGSIFVTTKELTPLRDMQIIKGYFGEIINSYRESILNDYIKVILYDENDIPDAIGKLRSIFPYLMSIEYSNKRTSSESSLLTDINIRQKQSDIEMLNSFYEMQNNQPLSNEQKMLAEKIFEEIREEEIL